VQRVAGGGPLFVKIEDVRKHERRAGVVLSADGFVRGVICVLCNEAKPPSQFNWRHVDISLKKLPRAGYRFWRADSEEHAAMLVLAGRAHQGWMCPNCVAGLEIEA
jgi:hypothetical protein